MSPPLPAIAVLSSGVLASEVLLTRVFAIIQVHHFAYMVISIALLGYGASGTFIALFRERLEARFPEAYAANATLFGLSMVAGFAIAERLPFNAAALVWDPWQLLYLSVLYALFTVPFFCAANCVGLAFVCFPDHTGRVYRYDLVGAGAGALGVVALLFMLFPSPALCAVAALGPLAAASAMLYRSGPRRLRPAAGLAVLALALAGGLPASLTELRLSEFKSLSQALLVPGTEIVAETSSPLGLVTVVRSPTIPFRYALGLSLANTQEPPEQLGVFVDGEGPSAINRFDGGLEPFGYLDGTTMALPYHLVGRPKVLVLGAGGGADVLLALYHGASRVDAVELDPNLIRLVADRFAAFAGGLYGRRDVRVHAAEARGFVAGTAARYDIIQIPLLDAFATAAAGTLSLSESTLYTVEALEIYLSHLAPDGMLAITRWLKLPPRDSLKLFATALAALERMGVDAPERRLALLRSWNTTTLLVKNGAFTEPDLASIRAFARSRSFDLVYVPGMSPREANRYNILSEPYFFEGAAALAGPERASFIERYKFDLRPATDDRPYFFDFFRWRALDELLELRAQGGAALLDWGYLLLFATLLQACVLSVALILLPLWIWRGAPAPGRDRRRVFAYFLAVGFAFFFVEVASIQRFMLFLSHPVYAVAVVLSAFLVFAGLGSGIAPRLARRLERRPAHDSPWPGRLPPVSALEVAVAAIAALAIVYLLALPPLFRWLMPLGDASKIAIAIVFIAPLAFWMGMPFPLALERVSKRLPALVPWAWGVNGCASVLSAVLATLLAMNIGFSAVVLLAVALYVLAAAILHAPFESAARPPS
ncbi:MAG: SAM-dependent methyltransferase [Alphaproteobacteria bacterium]|nr:SAM-dependent methyltransferase [Alphaproteobacteria bacterium]